MTGTACCATADVGEAECRRGPRTDPAGAPPGAAAGAGVRRGRLSPAVAWGVVGTLAVAVFAILLAPDGFAGDSGEAAPSGPVPGTENVVADTDGSYEELVQRGDELYAEGSAALSEQDSGRAAAVFAAAAEVYAAAWARRDTEPRVGTQYATALFRSGEIEAALEQIGRVLGASPDFQEGWLCNGVVLASKARIVDRGGDRERGEKLSRQARTTFTRAVAIDPGSEAGRRAEQNLRALGGRE